MDAPPDSLDGWVAVRGDAFGRPEGPHKLRFLVAWNALEGQFAVTCHDRAPREADGQPSSWAGLYSAQALRGVHRQLAALSERLGPCFPALPPALCGGGGGGLWALLFPPCPVLEEAEREGLCRRLEAYLGCALELCGRKALLDSLFAPDRDADGEYCEDLQEFRRKAHKAQLAAAKEALRRVLHRHKDADTLVALKAVYEEEDELYWELVTAATQFYQYLLQPFRDMRELATLYKLEILKSLQADRLGPKRIEALQKEAGECTTQVEEAMCSIQDITVSYFKETVMALSAMQKQMEQDRRRFGQAAWASVSPRLENLKYLLAKETLQHMRARELCLNHKRADIRKQMEAFEEQEKDLGQLEKLEIEYYETQLELYEVQFEILRNEEMLLVTQLETLRRQMKEIQDEVIYYDTCENPDELQTSEQVLEDIHAPSSEMAQLRQKTQQLEKKRGIICSRRAYLRNKKDQCEESRRLRLQQAQESVQHFEQHHSIQIKRDKRKEEEKKKKAWIKLESQKTLERLRTFKEKCPAQFVLKTSRSQPLNSKQRQGVPGRTPAPSPPPSSISKSPAKQSRNAHAAQAKGVRAPGRKPPADIPVQVFLPPSDSKQQNSEGGAALLPPPPPPPPLPPPLGPPPFCLKLTQAEDQPLPLKYEDPPRGSVSKADSHDASRCTASNYAGSMDEVLASLKRGEILLRKVEPPPLAPPSSSSLNDSILAAIRKGVKLRKVCQEPKKEGERNSDNELERSIKAAIQRIKKVSADSEEEEGGERNSEEWNS